MSVSAAASNSATSISDAACVGVQRVPRLVQPRSRQVLTRGEALIERLGRVKLLDDVGRQRFAGVDVTRVGAEHLGPVDPHLIDLTRKLHEVAEHVRSREVRVGHGGEQPVQGMPELMEERRHLVEREKRRHARSRLGDVEVVDDHRLRAAQARLRHDRVHPRAAALGVAGVQVQNEQPELRAVGIAAVSNTRASGWYADRSPRSANVMP